MPKLQDQRLRAASSERRAREKQALRQAIMDAATHLFVARGYEGLSMRQVAEAIGYTATTIYLYFQDKDELLFAVVDQAFDGFTAGLQTAYDSTSAPLERLYALGRAYIAFGRQNPGAYQLIFMQRPDFLLNLRSGEAAPRAATLLLLRTAIAQAQAAGLLKAGPIEPLSNAFWAAMHGAVALAISMPQLFGSGQPEAVLEMTLEVTINGMRL